MEIVNLTPHAVKVILDNGKEKVYLPTGNVARIKESRFRGSEIDGVPLNRKEFGEVEYLPAAAPHRVHIVSSQVVEYMRGMRSDLVAPDDLVRDDKGFIIGCKSFWYA